MSELTKNAANISKAIEFCPFMAHARRTLSSNAEINSLFSSSIKEEQSYQQVPSSTISDFLSPNTKPP
jgi:hypothetical protein